MKKKKGITIIASEQTYRNLSPFEKIEQLNEAVRHYRKQFCNQLNKTQLSVLDVLKCHSAKYTGVSFLTKAKIGKLVDKSRATVIRVCKHLEELGVIKQYDMKRSSDMQQTACAIVIQPFIEQVQEQTKIDNATQEAAEMQHQKTLHKTTNNNKAIRKESVTNTTIPMPKFIPSEFAELASLYYNDTKTVFELWGKVRLAYTHSKVEQPLGELTSVAIAAFRESIAAFKLRKLRNGSSLDSLRGYLYGTMRKMLFDLAVSVNVSNSFSLFTNILQNRLT
ncbi:helix-turn-helix domain-containing protein [Priestia megaterium]|uniref:helix-turn-helix domain-containing protein n=1 Tax=Priestia megaterium TaxID=1404 RepID=UPI001A950840|nr:helix-turn-helix domain-containing protein [Priestia megaterium]QSX18467.1 helix-turn-helix domain-containing protein [Priestia megaterium]